jgi:hypothetical protein
MLPQTWMVDTYPEKNKKKIRKRNKQSSDKENNEGCLPQALSFQSAILSTIDDHHFE